MLEGGEEACEWPLVLMMGGMCWLEGDLAAETVRFEASESQISREAGVKCMGSRYREDLEEDSNAEWSRRHGKKDQNQEDKA